MLKGINRHPGLQMVSKKPLKSIAIKGLTVNKAKNLQIFFGQVSKKTGSVKQLVKDVGQQVMAGHFNSTSFRSKHLRSVASRQIDLKPIILPSLLRRGETESSKYSFS